MRASKFKGKKDQGLTILVPAETRLERVYIAGLGKASELDDLAWQSIGGASMRRLPARPGKRSPSPSMLSRLQDESRRDSRQPRLWARLRSYRFDKYRTKEKAEDKAIVRTLDIRCAGHARARTAFRRLNKVADGSLHPRPGVRARQYPLSRNLGRRGPHPDPPWRQGRGPWRTSDAAPRHGRLARRRPGQRSGFRRWSSCSGKVAAPGAARKRNPSHSSARASPSTPAASRLNPPVVWRI